MILNHFDSSFMDCLDGNPMSQFGASDFVQTVMASSPLVNIEDKHNVSTYYTTVTAVADVHKTLSPSPKLPRKRHLSESDSEETIAENKKMKCSSPITSTPSPPFSDNIQLSAIVNMISKLSDNFNSVANRLEKRMCEIEGNVEKRLTAKCNTVIHDRVHKEVCQLNDQILTEVNEFKEKVISLEKSYAQVVTSGVN